MAVDRIGPTALLLLLLLLGVSCPGARPGQTSEYRRQLGFTIDMRLDADVFSPPPGHNAPEQFGSATAAIQMRIGRLWLSTHTLCHLWYLLKIPYNRTRSKGCFCSSRSSPSPLTFCCGGNFGAYPDALFVLCLQYLNVVCCKLDSGVFQV